MIGIVAKFVFLGVASLVGLTTATMGVVLTGGSSDATYASLIIAAAVLVGSFVTLRQGARYNFAAAMDLRIKVLEGEVDDWKEKAEDCAVARRVAEQRNRDLEERCVVYLTEIHDLRRKRNA